MTSWGFTQLVASKEHSITLLMFGVVFSVATLIDGYKEFGEVVILPLNFFYRIQIYVR